MIYWANIRSIVYYMFYVWSCWFVLSRPTTRMDTKRKYTKLIRNGFSVIKRILVRVWEYYIFEEMISERVNIVRSCQVRSCCFVSYHTSYCYLPRLAIFLDLRWVIAPLFTLELCFQRLGWETCKLFYVDYYRFYILSKLAMRID